MIAASDFGALRAFAAVADARSFSRAASVLGVSPSALSQTIRALEDRLGVLLLNRTTRSVAPTDAGEALLRTVQPAMIALDHGFDAARKSAGEVVGTIRIHAARLASRQFLAPRLAAFAQAYPRITLDLTLDDRTVDFVAEGFDAAIRVGEVIDQDMVALRLGRDLRQVAVASPTYLAEHGTPATPYDLAHHRCIRWRWPGHENPYAWEFQDNGRWFTVPVDGPLIVNDRLFGAEAALDGVGIAFVAEQAVTPYLAAGKLVPVLADWCPPFPGFFLCYPRQRHMPPPLRAFCNFIGMPTDTAIVVSDDSLGS